MEDSATPFPTSQQSNQDQSLPENQDNTHPSSQDSTQPTNQSNTEPAKQGDDQFASQSKTQRANQSNAQRSTGPRSPRGKAVVGRNALKHGIMSMRILEQATSQEREKFKKLSNHFYSTLKPVGAIEELLVDNIVVAYWRLARIASWEEMEIHRSVADVFEFPPLSDIAANAKKTNNPTPEAVDKFIRYQSIVERQLYRALGQLERVQRTRKCNPVPPPLTDSGA